MLIKNITEFFKINSKVIKFFRYDDKNSENRINIRKKIYYIFYINNQLIISKRSFYFLLTNIFMSSHIYIEVSDVGLIINHPVFELMADY